MTLEQFLNVYKHREDKWVWVMYKGNEYELDIRYLLEDFNSIGIKSNMLNKVIIKELMIIGKEFYLTLE